MKILINKKGVVFIIHLLPLITMVYMAVNVVTDIYKGITKNYIHFIYLVILGVYFVVDFRSELLAAISCVFLITFIVGFGLKRFLQSYGSGDIKMLFLLGITSILIYQEIVVYFFWVLSYLVVSVLHIVLTRVTCLIVGEWSFNTYVVTRKNVIVPEGVPFLISIILLFFLIEIK